MLSFVLLTLLLLHLEPGVSAAYIHTSDDIPDLIIRPVDLNPGQLRLWLTISARHRFLEVSWKNAPAQPDDYILVTLHEPHSFERIKVVTGTRLASFDNMEGSGYVPVDGVTSRMPRSNKDNYGVGSGDNSELSFIADSNAPSTTRTTTSTPASHYWISDNGANTIVAALQPATSMEWFTTGVPFDTRLSDIVSTNTSCYGYWANYVNKNGAILASACMRAYPRWMHELQSVIGALRLRDLFIPGTHDSGSYRPNFDPLLRETIVTKYALTQDDDIRGQLLHGARYLDIRVGYYRNTHEKFFINHGVVRQRPLLEVIVQVKEFVLETNEIVIFGLKEFPVGFGKTLGVHRLLVNYLKEHFGDLIVHPSATWRASLRDIWSRQQNVILAYDKDTVVHEFPQTLFSSVEQRWGNVQNWTKLEKYLRGINRFDIGRTMSRPNCDMAELTPDTWGVLLDKYGGLRKMADQVNWRLSQLYRDELGEHANIVAVDFIRGTNLVDTAIEWNKSKVIH